MKDAKGHGSDAHSTGVQQIGQPKEYTWAKYKDAHYLVPASDQVNGKLLNMGNQIATVHPYGDSTRNQSGAPRQMGEPYKKAYRAEYNYPLSTGTKQSDWQVHGSVSGGKKFVEGRMNSFWEPPKIVT
jgi:hypothetical protein